MSTTSNVSEIAIISQKDKDMIIENYKLAQRTKAQLTRANQSDLTKHRKGLNKNVASELMNFDDVFTKVIKHEFSFLTSRPTLAKVNESLELCKDVLFSLCSDAFAKKYIDEKLTINWERLNRLITDKKLLYLFCIDSQKKEGKVWSASQIIDLLLKGLTVKTQMYENSLKLRSVK